MKVKHLRSIAHAAARSLLRESGKEPRQCTVDSAFAVLDDLSRTHPEYAASEWYVNCSRTQEQLFRREWAYYTRTGTRG